MDSMRSLKLDAASRKENNVHGAAQADYSVNIEVAVAIEISVAINSGKIS